MPPMKKLISVLALTLLVSVPLLAQTGGGIKAGVNLADLKIEGDGFGLDFKNRIGFHAGLYYHLFFNENIAIQPELLFSQKGAKIDFSGFEVKTNFSYIDLPVLVRYQVVDFLNLHAGPQVGFLISANAVADDEKEDIKDDFNTIDFGLAFGAGVDLPMGLNFTLRYVLGLANIASETEGDESLKNNVLQVSVGYRLFGGD
jgi:hypothetical protein